MDCKKEFISQMKRLVGRYSLWEIWSDFITLTATGIYVSNKLFEWEKRQSEHDLTAMKYDKEELTVMEHLFEIIRSAYAEDTEQDFLGTIYMDLGLGKNQCGQYFTPYPVAKLMAMFNVTSKQDGEIPHSIHDPACGSGVMFIAIVNVLTALGDDYRQTAVFVGQDIDRLAVMMCYIQLYILECRACLIVGDSLRSPGLQTGNEIWCTPSYMQSEMKI